MSKVEPLRGRGPNILLIMADQHRADWMGCAGADWVQTPNLDALAARGLRFTRTATNSPLCAPARSALASGLRCSAVGVTENDDLYPYRTIPTYYQALRAAGYWVGCAGKTDLHKIDHHEGRHGNLPIMHHLGFTHPFETEGKQSGAHLSQGPQCPYQHHLTQRGLAEAFRQDYARRHHDLSADDSVLPLDAYHDSFIGERACEFLASIPGEAPWHYFVSFVGPHNPWDAPKEYSSRYRAADMPAERAIRDPLEGKPRRQKERLERLGGVLDVERLRAIWRQYAGAITLIDDYVGRFTEILRRRGELENTVVFYASDHGEMLGDRGLFTKSLYYEAALRVPLIGAGPGISARGESDALVHLFDLAPTCLELAQAEPLGRMEARSLLPLLRGETQADRSRQISELRHSRMLFDGRYKLAEWDGDGDELYDLEADPQERNNLATTDSGRAEAMRAELHERLSREDAF